MVAAQHDSTLDTYRSAVARLVDQLARATAELRSREAEGRPVGAVPAVVRSLRKTLVSLAEHGLHPDPSSAPFSCHTRGPGGMELRHRGERLPVNIRGLQQAFEDAGVDLEAGQTLVVDRELARRLMEESLVSLSLEEFRIRDAQSILWRALKHCPGTSLSQS